jgi:predicted RNA polymerase sigma factor
MSRGVVLQALARRPDALTSYDRAVSLAEADPGTLSREILPDALSSRASLLLELGLRDRARADLSRALSLCAEDWPQRDGTRARLEGLTAEKP